MADIRYNNVYWPDVVTCENCGHTSRPVHKHTFPPDPDTVYCPFCGEEVPLITVKPTNADRIRAMSDEELAEWGATLPCCPPGPDLVEACYPNNMCENTDFQKKCWLDWLKAEGE